MQAAIERESASGFVADWWRNWKRRRAAIEELGRRGEDAAAHIARAVGVSSSELWILAGKWPSSADLLSRRIVAVDLDAESITEREPEVLRDLQRAAPSARSSCAASATSDRINATRGGANTAPMSRRSMRCVPKIMIAGG